MNHIHTLSFLLVIMIDVDTAADRGRVYVCVFLLHTHWRSCAGDGDAIPPMKVGGTRMLYIPAKLGYGARGAGGVIPPNADLIFEVTLVAITN